jgi:hypothetical protein
VKIGESVPYVSYQYRTRPVFGPKKASVALAIACADDQDNVLGAIQDYYTPQWLTRFPWQWSATGVYFKNGITQLTSGLPGLITEGQSAFPWPSGGSRYLTVRIVMDYDAAEAIYNTPGALPKAIGGGPISSLVGVGEAPSKPAAGTLHWWITNYLIRLPN